MSDNEIKVKLTADVKDFNDKMKDAENAVDQFQKESVADIDAVINKMKDAESEVDSFQKKFTELSSVTGGSTGSGTGTSNGGTNDLIQSTKDTLGVQNVNDAMGFINNAHDLGTNVKDHWPKVPDEPSEVKPPFSQSEQAKLGNSDAARGANRFTGSEAGGQPKTNSWTYKPPEPELGPAPAQGRGTFPGMAQAPEKLAINNLDTAASLASDSMMPGEASMLSEAVMTGGAGTLEAGATTAGGMTATAFVAAVAAGIAVGLAGVWLLVNTGALNAIADLGTAFQKAAPGLMNIFKVLFWPLGVLGTAAIDLVTGRIDKIPADIMNVVEQAKKAAQELFGGISNVAMGALNGILGKINEIINSIKNIPSSASNAAGSIGGGIISGVTGFLGNIHLAEGGIVNGPTYSLIGEAGPEAVMPLSNLRSLLGGSGSQEIMIETPVYLDSDKIGEALTRRIRLREGI